jgi:hypothetical protein
MRGYRDENEYGSPRRSDSVDAPEPGKRTLTQVIQRRRAPGPGGTAARGGAGAPLPGGLAARMEQAFGFDFGDVRVHEGGEAAAVGAQAYAQGSDLFFAPGHYDPDSGAGQELIGHELAHVVQQSEGRVAETTQFKGAAGNDDASLEREADELGARAARGERVRGGGLAAPAAAGPIQRRTPTAREVAAARSFTVPAVADLSRIPDPVNRNQAINQSYHAFDVAMTGYMGDPLVANWFTFGQHASREAGTQIRNLQHGLQVLRDALPVLTALGSGSLLAMFGQAERAVRMIERILDLLSQDGLMQMALQLALARAGITQADLQQVVTDAQTALAVAPIGGVMNPIAMALFARFMGRLTGLAARLIVAIPAIIQSVEHVYANMQQGNREIYENVAPAAAQFLTAAQGAPDGVPPRQTFTRDPSGFLSAAFAEYAEVRRLGDEARAAPGTPEAAAKLSERQGKAHHANLVVGFQEQLIILQPIFDTMQLELQAMSGTMVLHDPNGAHPLAGNWGDFYTRMGIDPARAPADPTTIRADSLPPLLPAGDPRRRGTISEYFEDGLTDERVHEAPPSIAPI